MRDSRAFKYHVVACRYVEFGLGTRKPTDIHYGVTYFCLQRLQAAPYADGQGLSFQPKLPTKMKRYVYVWRPRLLAVLLTFTSPSIFKAATIVSGQTVTATLTAGQTNS
jgi:hypothetical protein